jgi:hypothetical protein
MGADEEVWQHLRLAAAAPTLLHISPGSQKQSRRKIHEASGPLSALQRTESGVPTQSLSIPTQPVLPHQGETMNTLKRTAHLIAVAAAATVTTALLSAVVSIAEPQRSALMAKNAADQKLMAGRATLQVAQAR